MNHVLRCFIVWNVESPWKYPSSISVSETVNHDGIYRQNRLCHSFSGDANQNGWVNVPSKGAIVVAPDIVETIVTIT